MNGMSVDDPGPAWTRPTYNPLGQSRGISRLAAAGQRAPSRQAVRLTGSGVGAGGRPATSAMNTSSAACRYTLIVYAPTRLLTKNSIVSPGWTLPAVQYPASGVISVDSGGSWK